MDRIEADKARIDSEVQEAEFQVNRARWNFTLAQRELANAEDYLRHQKLRQNPKGYMGLFAVWSFALGMMLAGIFLALRHA